MEEEKINRPNEPQPQAATQGQTAGTDVLDMRQLAKKLLQRKKLFAIVLAITFIVSCLLIISVPRYYNTVAKIVPEMDGAMKEGTLGSLASSFGLGMLNGKGEDAISPLIYPDLIEDNGFAASLFPVKVVSADGKINTTYFDYIKTKQKNPWWAVAVEGVKRLVKSSKPAAAPAGAHKDSPYFLSEKDNNVADAIRGKLKFAYDKKTSVITIDVTDQDPAICKTIADSVQEKLQTYITNYRTSKARVDLAFYERMSREKKAEYDSIRRRYASYSDANQDVELVTYKSKIEDMENEMQLRYNAYSTMNMQLQAAYAKVQERTPVFTVIRGAAYPVKPAGPKRMLFVAFMLFVATIATAGYVLKDDLLGKTKH